MKLRNILFLLLFLALANSAFAQCGPLVLNPVTGLLDCSGSGATGATGPAGSNGAAGSFAVPNDGTTGTTLHQLAKINASGNAINAAVSDTAVPVFIVNGGAGASGSATLAIGGLIACTADAGGATIGHFIVASTATAGRCMDAGATLPASGWVVGIAQTTATANASTNVALSQGYAGLGFTPFNVANNLSEGVAATMRTNLGLGTAAVVSSTCAGDLSGTLPNCNVVASAITLAKMANLAANSAICNNTGSGATPIACSVAQMQALLGTNFTLVTPAIASFVNAAHNHQNAAGGGTLAEAALALTDITTNNASTSNHGFLPKLDNVATHFLNGQGGFTTPPGGGTIPATSSALKGDGAGNALAVTGTSTNCVHVDGTSAACPGGGGTGNAAGYTAVTFSATPTFTAASNTVDAWAITLTANVTSSTLASATAGERLGFKICQDATGGRAFAWPTGFSAASTISPVASVCSKQEFYWDGTNAQPLGSMTIDGGPMIMTEQAAPSGTPASTFEWFWADSTGLFPRSKNSAGTFFQWAKELTSGNVRCAGGANTVDAACTPTQLNTAIGAAGLTPTNGGTGLDTHSSTGIAQVNAGTWSISAALAAGTTATTQSADDNSTKIATTAYVDRMKARGISFTIGDPGNSTALTTSSVTYVTVPFACTISAYNLLIDAGTVTVKFWKIATGTAIPTISNSINTSGVSISSGTAIHSTTVSDFTTTTVTANDILAVQPTAVATAKFFNGVLECDQ